MKKFLIVFFITGTFLYGQTDTVLVSQDTNKTIVESDVNTDQENIDSEWLVFIKF